MHPHTTGPCSGGKKKKKGTALPCIRSTRNMAQNRRRGELAGTVARSAERWPVVQKRKKIVPK